MRLCWAHTLERVLMIWIRYHPFAVQSNVLHTCTPPAHKRARPPITAHGICATHHDRWERLITTITHKHTHTAQCQQGTHTHEHPARCCDDDYVRCYCAPAFGGNVCRCRRWRECVCSERVQFRGNPIIIVFKFTHTQSQCRNTSNGTRWITKFEFSEIRIIPSRYSNFDDFETVLYRPINDIPKPLQASLAAVFSV